MIGMDSAKVFRIVLLAVTIFTGIVQGYSGSSNLIQVDDKSFKSVVIDSGKYVLVDFYADWCRHCGNLMPTVEQLADLYEPYQDQITIVKVNGDKDGKKMARKYADKGFPTLKLFHGADKPIEFDGSRDLQSLSNFVQVASGVRIGDDNKKEIENKQQILEIMKNKDQQQQQEQDEQDHLIRLSDENFDEKVLNSGVKHSIVVFSATWCNYCKELRPIIDQFSNEIFVNDKNQVQFGIVEKDVVPADKLGEKYHIEYLPTVLYFNSDVKDEPIVIKNRDFQGLLDKINDLTRIHRDGSGRLTNRAGRIEKLDRIIDQKHLIPKKDATTKSSKEVAIDILSKEIGKFEDFEMINYYKKLINKIIDQDYQESEKFFQNEINRLTNILTNDVGKLKSTIIDSMERRLNILKVFVKGN